MDRIIGNSFTDVYYELIKNIHDRKVIEGKFYEAVDVNFRIEYPTKGWLLFKKNWEWCFQEMFDRLGPTIIPEYKSNPGYAYLYRASWKNKLEKEGGKFCYCYAEAFANQLPKVIKKLRNKSQREAIITVWDQKYLDEKSYLRRPCTLTLHYLIRDKRLNCFVNMRSNDAINLLPYDVFQHTFLQQYIAAKLGLQLGFYSHTCSHTYYHKRREDPNRNYIERLLLYLENLQAANITLKVAGLNPETLDQDMLNAYSILDAPRRHFFYFSNYPLIINSPLILNMVKVILNKGKVLSTHSRYSHQFSFIDHDLYGKI